MPAVAKSKLKQTRTARLGLRATRQQEVLIRRAAEATGKSVTEFVLNSACVAAESAILNQRLFFADDGTWQAFVEALERPAQIKARLGELMRHRAPWEE
ncbi:MAG: DUF1778 domain-containing protein [Deltaproteobacteria bacterium]|nr:DUF1778 domain-containing protein [Deltaproteobacteria bacterium]MBW1793485.1 DUF1778 domain-containing protein [Deltaproteobacteria bacterium]